MPERKTRLRRPTPSEQQVLDHFQVRLLTKEADIERFDELIVAHHYLKCATLVGENLRYVATYRGQWLALLAFRPRRARNDVSTLSTAAQNGQRGGMSVIRHTPLGNQILLSTSAVEMRAAGAT